MKGITLLTAIALTTILGCEIKKENPEVLKQVLIDFFDGVKTQDLDKLNAVTTSDFILFEDGRIWTNDSLVQPNPNIKSFSGTWTLDYMKIDMGATHGDVIYRNHGDFLINDSIKVQVDWLENATFKKIDGQWKMKFLHSTVQK